jgi:lipoprotein-anchoring transpeptidase ErfK/SrfK
MHTVPWKERNTKGYVYKGQFNKLGTRASGGCVRMPYKLAKYIYEKCPIGTPVKVFNGKAGSYPMGKPKKYTATSNLDPTR